MTPFGSNAPKLWNTVGLLQTLLIVIVLLILLSLIQMPLSLGPRTAGKVRANVVPFQITKESTLAFGSVIFNSTSRS